MIRDFVYYHDVATNTFYKVEGDKVTVFPSKSTPAPTPNDLRQMACHPASTLYIINEGEFKSKGLTNLKLKV